MKRYLSILSFLFTLGFPQFSYSVSNQDLMDRLDDMEFEQEMREHERRMKQLRRDLELQKQQPVPRTKTNLQDIYLNNHILIYSSPDERVYMNQRSIKTKTDSGVFYIVEHLNPISNLPNVRYTDKFDMIDCKINTMRTVRIFMLDQNFTVLKNYIYSFDYRKIKDGVDTSIKNYMCLR